jgi:hypothetical protein
MSLFFFFFTGVNALPEHHKETFNGSIEQKIKLLLPVLSDQNDWWVSCFLPKKPSSSKSSNQSFEIAIFLA